MVCKNTFKSASKFGFWGMLINLSWVLFSLFVLSFFKGSAFGEVIKGINGPLLYQVSENFFHFLVKLGLSNKHNALFYFLIVFVVYSTIGYLLGFFCYFFRKSLSH